MKKACKILFLLGIIMFSLHGLFLPAFAEREAQLAEIAYQQCLSQQQKSTPFKTVCAQRMIQQKPWLRYLQADGSHLAPGLSEVLPEIFSMKGESKKESREVGNPFRFSADFGRHRPKVKKIYNPLNNTGRAQAEIHAELIKTFSPIVIHGRGRHPEYDKPVAVDFDGDLDSSNNQLKSRNLKKIQPAVYAEVVGETADAWYLFYGFYHVRDYDSHYREFFFSAAAHDNDFEGIMLFIPKDQMLPIAMETWGHNRFYQFELYYDPNLRRGQQYIEGPLLLDQDRHPIIYISEQGHGIRAANEQDIASSRSGEKSFYKAHDLGTQNFSSAEGYQIMSMEIFYRESQNPHSLLLVGASRYAQNATLNMFLAGRYQGRENWARPKAPWAWFETVLSAGVGKGVWYFHPALVFSANFGYTLEKDYHWNAPLQQILSPDQRSNFLQRLSDDTESRLSQNLQPYSSVVVNTAKRKLRKILDQLFEIFG